MKTWEVRLIEDNGEVTSVFCQAADLESLYVHLGEWLPDARVLGCPKVA